MKLTDEQVRYVASLANLNLTEEEIARMAHDLSDILAHMDSLAAIDTEGVAPMTQVLYDAAETAHCAHVERASLGNDLAVANASVTSDGYFKVPRVIEK